MRDNEPPVIDPASPIPICSPMPLPPELAQLGAQIASRVNPANRVPSASLLRLAKYGGPELAAQHAAILSTAYWGARGVHLSVGFLEKVPADFKDHVLSHMNIWGKYGNVAFTLTPTVTKAQVRITVRGEGYWSYLGTGILAIPAPQPTMCLQDFDRGMPESEYKRVIRHETGHTLGMPHDHARPEIVALLDEARTIEYFGRTQGWPPDMVRSQILTPLNPASLMGGKADVNSIMAYQFEGYCTKSRQPIPGGYDLDALDKAVVAALYPKASRSAAPEPPAFAEVRRVVSDLMPC